MDDRDQKYNNYHYINLKKSTTYLNFLGISNFLRQYSDVERWVLDVHTHLLDGDDVLACLARSEADADVARWQAFEEAGFFQARGSLMEEKTVLKYSFF